MNLLSAKQAGEKWGLPADAEKPVNGRIKTGKYINRFGKQQKATGRSGYTLWQEGDRERVRGLILTH